MDDFNVGKVLEIPQSVFDNIEKIDTKINSIATDSEKMATQFGASMVKMSNSTNDLLTKLTAIQEVVKGIGNINIGTDLKASSGLENTSNQAEKAASNITKAMVALGQLYDVVAKSITGKSILDKIADLNTKEKANEIDRLANSAKEMSRSIAQSEKESALASQQRAHETALAKQEESNAFNKRMTELKEESKLLKANAADYSNYLSAVAMSENSEDSRAKKIERMSSVMQDLRRNESMYAREIDILSKKIEALTRENESLAKTREKTAKQKLDYRQETKALDAYNRAMSASEGTMSQRINKIVKLQHAERMLNQTGSKYADNVRRIRAEIERLNKVNKEQENSYSKIHKSQSKLMDISGQLARKLALVFSVSQVQGYVMNIVRVTGEFEKQNVALATILQNKDKADKLFAQVTELAVQSPFQLKELVTYTKELSAYQIEYEKLFDTTKMLADVSSGLGVDMSRLILAFGQVKAANFLRGTEVRQFTEAGFNVLGELAKYYGELEGRMISVGEVQEMVSKRMVKFGDVEEVFKRVTSAGGIFYKMQEKQAETLAGQMSNLEDSIDIMFNDIGSANSGVIKDAIGSVRSLLENWRELAAGIKMAAIELSPFVTYMVLAKVSSSSFGTAVASLGKSLFTSEKALKATSTAMTTVASKSKAASIGVNVLKTSLNGIATLGIGAIIMGIVYGFEQLYLRSTKASRQAEELGEKLGDITYKGEYNAEKMSTRFEQLANSILDSSKSADEHKEAMDEMKRTYSDILPSYAMTTEGLEKMKGDYDSVTKAIYAKIEAQVKEKQITAVSEIYSRDVQSSMDKVKNLLVKQGGMLAEDANSVVLELRKAIEDGRVKIGDDYTAFVEDIVKKNYGLSIKLKESTKVFTGNSLFSGKKLFDKIEAPSAEVYQLILNVQKFGKEVKKIQDSNLTSLGGTGEYNALKKSLDAQKELIIQAKKQIAEEGKKEGRDALFISEAQIAKEKEMLIQWAGEFISGKNKIITAYGQVVDATSQTSLKFISDLNDQLNNVDGTDAQKEVRGVIREFNKLNGLNLKSLDKVMIGSAESMSEYKKRLTNYIKEIEERMKGYKSGASKFITYIRDDIEYANAETELSLAKYIKSIEFPETPTESKGGGSGESKEIKRLKKQIELIKKAASEYEKLRKYYNDEDSKKQIESAFGDAFENLGLSVDMNFDAQGVIDALTKLSDGLSKDAKKVMDETLAPLKSEQHIKVRADGFEEIKEEIDDIFQSYEFSVDLQAAGIDPTALKRMLKSLNVSDDVVTSIGLDTTTFEEAMDRLNEKKKELLKLGGKENIDEAEKLEKRITQAVLKEARSRLNELATLRKKYQTKEEKIEHINADVQRWKQELKQIEASGNEANKEQKELLELRIKNGEEAINALQLESLQLTSFWQMLFGELDNLSVKTLRKIIHTNEQIINSIKEVRDKQGDVKGYEATFVDDKGIERKVKLSIQQYQRLLRQNNKVYEEVKKKNPFISLFDAIKKGKNEGESSLDYMERLKGSIDGVIGVAGEAANNLADIFGASEDTKQTIADIQNLISGVADAGMGIAKLASGDIVGGSLQAIGGIAKLMTSIFSIGDRKKEKEIKRQIEMVDELRRAYDKLAESIDNAYSIDTLESSSKQAESNLVKQNEALSKAINKELDKKHRDLDRVKDWEQQIEDNNEKIKEIQEDRIASLGGLGSEANIKSAAEAFTDAWYEAFKETGDGLVGLEDNFGEMFDNIIKKQIMLKATERFLKPFFEQIDAVFKSSNLGDYMTAYKDGVVSSFDGANATKEELEAILEKSKEVFPAMNEYLKQLMSSLGVSGGIKGEGEEQDKLTGLQRGIQSVSEETASIIASITESIRFFVADSNAQLKLITNSIVTPTEENPYLTELRNQTNYMSMMYSLWNSLTMTKSGVSGKCLKINIM